MLHFAQAEFDGRMARTRAEMERRGLRGRTGRPFAYVQVRRMLQAA